MMECQATFKEHCQWPKCDCDRYAVCLLTAEQIKTIDLDRRPELKKYIEDNTHTNP